MLQLLVMLMLAVPACCYELEPSHGKPDVSHPAKVIDVGRDECPCCPGENEADSDICSTCSYCSLYAPLLPATPTKYDPSIAQLIALKQFTKLTDVLIPIFVPPQNLA